MSRSDDEPLRVDDRLLAETQRSVNDVFCNDLIFPVYLKSGELRPDCKMSVSGGASSLYYRDKTTDWQGAGFVIETHQAEMSPASFNGGILHEISHCFQSELGTPWSCLPQEMGFPAVEMKQIQSVRSTAYQCYLFHRADFWRICGHVWTRGVHAFPCRFSDLGRTWVEPDEMLATLASEIERRRHQPLWRIAMSPVPRDFESLFDFNVNDWDKFECPSTINNTEKNP